MVDLTLRERMLRLANLIERQTERESGPCEFRHADTGVWWDVADAIRMTIEGIGPVPKGA
jgi:hypothetical protein